MCRKMALLLRNENTSNFSCVMQDMHEKVVCMTLSCSQLSVPCDENEQHTAVLYCTVCMSHLCEECSELTHATRTLARHRRVPLSDKPREKPKCPSHPSHVAEFTCLEDDCQTLQSGPGPIMCFICKDYGRHKNHKVSCNVGIMLSDQYC
jgi:tripartite motif-containing protein 23